MKHIMILFAMVSVVSASIVLAAPPKHAKKPNTKTTKVAKVIDVWTDPMYGEEVPRNSISELRGKPILVGVYRLHFGDLNSLVAFDRLSDKDKKARAEAAAKKDRVRTDDAGKNKNYTALRSSTFPIPVPNWGRPRHS